MPGEPRTEAGRRLLELLGGDADEHFASPTGNLILAIEDEAASPVPAPTLDAAWAEAEAALPEGTWLIEFGRRDTIAPSLNPRTGYPVKFPGRYFASASREFDVDEGPTEYADTPAAALRALTAALSETRTVTE